MITNLKLEIAFVHEVAHAEMLAEKILQFLGDNMNVNPDTLNWAHVGDATRIREALREITEIFNLK